MTISKLQAMKRNNSILNLLGLIHSMIFYLVGTIIIAAAIFGAYYITREIPNIFLKTIFYFGAYLIYYIVKKTFFKLGSSSSAIKKAIIYNDSTVFYRQIRMNCGGVILSTLLILYIGCALIVNIENLERSIFFILFASLFIPTIISTTYLILLKKQFRSYEKIQE